MDCPICQAENEEILWQSPNIRVIAVHNEANAPAFCRVIWQAHVAEMTDLPPESRWQFERLGYFVTDRKDHRPEQPVFNRTVTLKDSWQPK